jgi:hypothetical protein
LVGIDYATYEEIKDSCIIVNNLKRRNINTKNCSDGGIVSSNIIGVGKNCQGFSQCTNGTVVDVKDICDGYIIVLCAPTEECLYLDSNITIVPHGDGNSAYAILMILVSDMKKFVDTSSVPIWNNWTDLEALRKLKSSTIKVTKSNHHYGSQGQCYSFGIRNSYSTNETNLISIKEYAGDEKHLMRTFKYHLWKTMELSFKCYDHIISGISSKMYVFNTALQYHAKNTELSNYIRKMEKSRKYQFMLSGHININARTQFLHCEKDVSYTTIQVPKQTENDNFVEFEFFFNTHSSLRILLRADSCVSYSAYCLSHRQIKTSGERCMNISTYSGKRLYNHFRESMTRLIESKIKPYQGVKT